MEAAKTMKTSMSSSIKLDKDEKDADFSSCTIERKSTSDTCHFLGHSLVSWHSKKPKFGSFVNGRSRPDQNRSIGSSGLGFLSDSHALVSPPFLKAQGKCPVVPCQLGASARFDIALFNSMEDYQQYKQKSTQRKVVPGRNINFSQLQHFKATYGIGGPIISIVRGVEIRLDSESICCIFDITSIGLKVRPGNGKISVHSLTVISRVLHHMICSILLPQGGHRDEVSYYEAFLMDSILTGRRSHLGYLMMIHMISFCESTTCVLPYGRFLTRVFKNVGVDLSREIDF
ncbi:hypothetical protein CK203_056574 [Vitis vinifera]|uniref:Putative plant transposon protein domain-containing protein n=1 Tax=Vitis vinifera TaxID=29760 RepID=A0A438GKB9_VITVI|nr:hypothetical protein CK203_056574 [Vitis vinifera]